MDLKALSHPSKRFRLTVNTVNQTNLNVLDTHVDKFTKKWAGLPPSATNAIILKERSTYQPYQQYTKRLTIVAPPGLVPRVTLS